MPQPPYHCVFALVDGTAIDSTAAGVVDLAWEDSLEHPSHLGNRLLATATFSFDISVMEKSLSIFCVCARREINSLPCHGVLNDPSLPWGLLHVGT